MSDCPDKPPRPVDILNVFAAGQAAGDMAVLTMTVAALTPLIDSLMALSAANAQRLHQANHDSSQTALAGLAAVALAVGKLLQSEPQPGNVFKSGGNTQTMPLPSHLNLAVT